MQPPSFPLSVMNTLFEALRDGQGVMVIQNNMQINSYSFPLRLYYKFARTQHEDVLYRPLLLLNLHWGWAHLQLVHEETARVEFVEAAVRFPLGRGFEDKRA